jgi:hypothetical protein
MARLARPKRMEDKRVVQVVARLAKAQGLRDVYMVKVAEGILLQGLARRRKKNVDYLVCKTQLLSYEELEKLATGL